MNAKRCVALFCLVIGILFIFFLTSLKKEVPQAPKAEVQKKALISNEVQEEKRVPITVFNENSWNGFVKPGEETLRSTLSPLQYAVTQEEGTEPPFDNPYAHNTEAGIYVDIVSGEPLFSSKDKYDSGTGWPSFVRPLTEGAVTVRTDTQLFETRTEVRSLHADSHLGHVFDDGPANRGGKRYCMNSASLLFIAKADMEKEGYGYLLSAVE